MQFVPLYVFRYCIHIRIYKVHFSCPHIREHLANISQMFRECWAAFYERLTLTRHKKGSKPALVFSRKPWWPYGSNKEYTEKTQCPNTYLCILCKRWTILSELLGNAHDIDGGIIFHDNVSASDDISRPSSIGGIYMLVLGFTYEIQLHPFSLRVISVTS